MRKLNYTVICVFIMVLSAVFTGISVAQEKKAVVETKPETKRQVFKKEVVGEVAGIAANFLAVDYKADAKGVYELTMIMDKNTKFSRKNLKEINAGDLVAVSYEETIETAEGQKPKTLKRLAKVVEFRQAAKISPETTGVLESR